jgi:hypothetical protein
MRRIFAGMALGVLAVLVGCSGPTDAASRSVAPDPIIVAASRTTTAPPVAIVGYVLGFVKKRSGGVATAEVVATTDGRLLYTPWDGRSINAGNWRELEATPTTRAMPETPAEARARQAVVAAAARRVGRNGNGTFAGVTPTIENYLVRDSAGDLFYVAPDASKVSTVPALVTWPETYVASPRVSSVMARGLQVEINANYASPSVPNAKVTPLPAGKRWLSIRAWATNSTDATMALRVRHNLPVVRDAANRRLDFWSPSGASLSGSGAVGVAGGYMASGARPTTTPVEGLRPGGSLNFQATYAVPANAHGLTFVWTFADDRIVVFQLP